MAWRPPLWKPVAVGAIAVGTVAIAVFGVLRDGSQPPVTSGVADQIETPSVVSATGYDAERGRPAFTARFESSQHGGHRQSWDVVQAPSGLVYVANSNGVLEYDGSDWRLIRIPGFRARAITTGPDGDIYVGGEGTAGVLVPDSARGVAYQELIGPGELNGEPVWAAVADDDGVVFQTFDRLVRVRGRRVVSVQQAPEGRRYHKAFEAAGRIYVRLEGAGLLHVQGNQLRGVPGGDAFADIPVRAIFAPGGASTESLLVVTDAQFYRLDLTGAGPTQEISSEASTILRTSRAYHGCALGSGEGDGRFLAITTLGSGVVIVDPAGNVVQRMFEQVAITADDLVLGCTVDAQGGLWLALSEGIVRVDAAGSLSVFDRDLGLPGVTFDVARHNTHLYAATERGVYRLRTSTGNATARFDPVTYEGRGIGQAWDLLPTSDGLLVASTDGVFEVSTSGSRRVTGTSTFVLTAVGETVYAGLSTGVEVLRRSPIGWVRDGRIEGIDGEVRSIVADGAGGAWIPEWNGPLVHVGKGGHPVREFGVSSGVPAELAFLDGVGDALVAVASDGPYRIETAGASVRVVPDTALTHLAESVVGDLADGFGLLEDATGRLWISGQDRVRAFADRDGQWVDVTPAPLRSLPDVTSITVDGDVVWVAAGGDLFRLASGAQDRYRVAVPTLIRSVVAGDEDVPTGESLTIPYGRPVRFRFAAAAYNAPRGTEYRTRLAGYDEKPSPWSSERYRDYTFLPPGTYRFHVEARTAQGAAARPASVSLTIPAPWYLTPWAHLLYAISTVAGVAGVAYLASRRQRRRADAERVRADELDRLNAELRRVDKLKDDMLANTSHELRTPLTAILGFSEMLAENDDPGVRAKARHVLSGGHRLLSTVNALLEIAQLRAGRTVLHPVATDAAALAQQVADELRPLAEGKGLGLAVVPVGLTVTAQLDPDAFVRILTNLIGNAIKFTNEGAVTVSVDGVDGDLHVRVCDTGRGIDPAFLPRLFDDFEQASTGYGRAAEGNGLGLSITSRLVDLMDGEIKVESEVGVGTTFHVTIPAAVETALRPEARPTERVGAELVSP